ncbi:hypothetical protein ACF0H5_006657 [Mactra antiquata]
MLRAKLLLPKPNQVPVKLKENMRVLLISEQINSLSKRIHNELQNKKVNSNLLETSDAGRMMSTVQDFQPDIIVCPFMKARLPEALYTTPGRPCLIVHPGIAGDRGASSLDWAIRNKNPKWGVTVLEASPVFDKGDIWSTEDFNVPENSTKSSLYNGCVSDAAVRCVVDSLSRFSQSIPASSYDDVEMSGTFNRNMKHADRRIDWNSNADDICAQVRMSDTRPGAIGQLSISEFDNECRMFDANVETGEHSAYISTLMKKAKPSDIVAQRNKSMLIKTGDEQGVWIGHMKKMTKNAALKLPSIDFLTNILHSKSQSKIPIVNEPCKHDDLFVTKHGQVAHVYFDFYNGAMDRQQGKRLKETLSRVNDMKDVKVVVLMGGDRFFSTGINLCVIEGSRNKQVEAWANINAINDVIESFINMTNKTTVAVVRGNAGAGGVMMAAACDIVLSHEGALLTPSYKTMNLFGSEYWTYFLPRRVGHDIAKALIDSTDSLSADEAKSIGLVDNVLYCDKTDCIDEASTYVEQIITDGIADNIIRRKRIEHDTYWRQLLHSHRVYELSHMKQNFRSSDFLTAMHNFVWH